MAIRDHILGVNHVMVGVSDLERSIEFYEQFGFSETFRIDVQGDAFAKGSGLKNREGRMALLGRPNFTLELVQPLPQQSVDVSDLGPLEVGSHHVCFEVQDLPGLHASLLADGVRFRGEVSQFPDYPLRFVYMLDPDGNTVELLEQTGPLPEAADA